MSEFVEFAVDNSQRLERLQSVFAALKQDKDADDFRPDEDWPSLFDQKALDCFEWPTAELRPVRITPTEKTTGVRWHFFSMIDAFHNGEYELLDCRLIGDGKGRLDFYALAYPYGGVGCMVALVEAFGFTVTGIDDGTGFREIQWNYLWRATRNRSRSGLCRAGISSHRRTMKR